MVFVRRLVWNERNIAHIARHEVTADEVEEVCHGDFVALESYQGRLLLLGPTATGRMLGVVLEPQSEAGVYFPVTARPASRRERRYY
jgi:uncharacterized DUF497 family protein